MLTLALPNHISFCVEPTDMRVSFDRLAMIVREQLQHDPLDGSLFVFRSKRRDRIKLLYWDQDGYSIWMKHLEQGTYQFPNPSTNADALNLTISATELSLILSGINLDSVKRLPRYYHSPEATTSATPRFSGEA